MCLILIESALECQKRLLYMPAVDIGRRHLIHSLHAAEMPSIFCLRFLFPIVSLLWQHSFVKCATSPEVFPCSCCARRCKRLRWKVLWAQQGFCVRDLGCHCISTRWNKQHDINMYQTTGYQWISRFHKIPGSQLNFIAFPVHALSSSFSSGHAVSKQLGSGSCWGVPAPAHCRCAGGGIVLKYSIWSDRRGWNQPMRTGNLVGTCRPWVRTHQKPTSANDDDRPLEFPGQFRMVCLALRRITSAYFCNKWIKMDKKGNQSLTFSVSIWAWSNQTERTWENPQKARTAILKKPVFWVGC